MTVGSVEAEVNGEKITLDTAPEFSSERTVVPVRFIAESFGLNVDWDEESGTVIIEQLVLSNHNKPKFFRLVFLYNFTKYSFCR